MIYRLTTKFFVKSFGKSFGGPLAPFARTIPLWPFECGLFETFACRTGHEYAGRNPWTNNRKT